MAKKKATALRLAQTVQNMRVGSKVAKEKATALRLGYAVKNIRDSSRTV